jgi:hypothetical protein
MSATSANERYNKARYLTRLSHYGFLNVSNLSKLTVQQGSLPDTILGEVNPRAVFTA